MKKRIVSLTASAVFALTGCITHETTVQRDVERVKVEFENESAARIFYEALSKTSRDSQSESRTKVEIPVVFEHTCKVVTGHNAAFNRAVEICDTNKDGRISEMEAKIFAEQADKR